MLYRHSGIISTIHTNFRSTKAYIPKFTIVHATEYLFSHFYLINLDNFSLVHLKKKKEEKRKRKGKKRKPMKPAS